MVRIGGITGIFVPVIFLQINAQRCPVLIPPENAETVCSIEKDGQEICQIFCDDDFTFARATNNQFACIKGAWNPDIILPACVSKSAYNESKMKAEFFFQFKSQTSTNRV